MKKIIVRAGYHFELSAGYVKLSPIYDQLTKQQKLEFLNHLIDELAFEKSFIEQHSAPDAPLCCPTIVDQPVPVDASS
jgi:hypothetical protein